MDPKKSAKENPDAAVWVFHLMDASTLTKNERDELLFKLNRIFTFVGTEIPEEIDFDLVNSGAIGNPSSRKNGARR